MYYELVLLNDHGRPILTQLPKFGPCESRETAIALGHELYAQHNRESMVAVYYGPPRPASYRSQPHSFPMKVTAGKALCIIDGS